MKKLISEIKRSGSTSHFYDFISEVSVLLAEVRSDNFDIVINYCLKLLGDLTKADRVYIFKYDFEEKTSSNMYEYCAKNIAPEIQNLQNISFEPFLEWINIHQKGKAIYHNDVSKMEDNSIKEMQTAQGVKSFLTLPLLKKERLFGFIGLESIIIKRKYSTDERKFISVFANILMSALARHELEQNLEKERIKMQLIVEAADIGVWEWNLETNKLKINDLWARCLGYTSEELKPHNIDLWRRLTHPDDLKNAEKLLQKIFEGTKTHYQIVIRMKHKDGHYAWIHDTGKIIERKNGKPTKMLGSHLDITDVKKKEEQNKVIKAATDYSSVAILITDVDGKIVYLNPQFTSLTGYSFVEAIGKNVNILESGYHDENFYKKMYSELRKGNQYVTEICNCKKNGETYWESNFISPVFDEFNKITHFIEIKTDITEKKAADDYLAKKRIKLEQEIEEKISEIEDSQKASIIALAKITEAREKYTGQHIERVQYLCKALTSSLKESKQYQTLINNEFVNEMFFASALHDIGKVRVPDSILLKPGKLDSKERKEMEKHVSYGADILSEMVRYYPRSKLIVLAKEIAKYHHERYDGTGYLEGLSGKAIPLPARIMAIVDVYDALRSKRPYKEAFAHKKAHGLILNEKGKHFDPIIVEAFDQIHEQFETIYDSLSKD
jgi:PAS domain S-box-containing protein